MASMPDDTIHFQKDSRVTAAFETLCPNSKKEEAPPATVH